MKAFAEIDNLFKRGIAIQNDFYETMDKWNSIRPFSHVEYDSLSGKFFSISLKAANLNDVIVTIIQSQQESRYRIAAFQALSDYLQDISICSMRMGKITSGLHEKTFRRKYPFREYSKDCDAAKSIYKDFPTKEDELQSRYEEMILLEHR